MYLDGVLKDTKTVTGINNTAGHCYVGKDNFDGTIDEVRVSNIARTSFPAAEGGGCVSSGTITSSTINSGEPITNIRLDWEDTVPAGTSINYSASNDGGAHWYGLPGDNVLFAFPSPGNDLRVRAELSLATGKTSPVLHAWTAEYFSSLNSVVWDALNNEAIGGAKVTFY